MPTYDVLVSDELLPDFTNDNPRLPNGFRIIGPADGPAGPGQVRMRVEDDNAPAWTGGELVTLDEHHGRATACKLVGTCRAHDASTDHDHVRHGCSVSASAT